MLPIDNANPRQYSRSDAPAPKPEEHEIASNAYEEQTRLRAV